MLLEDAQKMSKVSFKITNCTLPPLRIPDALKLTPPYILDIFLVNKRTDVRDQTTALLLMLLI